MLFGPESESVERSAAPGNTPYSPIAITLAFAGLGFLPFGCHPHVGRTPEADLETELESEVTADKQFPEDESGLKPDSSPLVPDDTSEVQEDARTTQEASPGWWEEVGSAPPLDEFPPRVAGFRWQSTPAEFRSACVANGGQTSPVGGQRLFRGHWYEQCTGQTVSTLRADQIVGVFCGTELCEVALHFKGGRDTLLDVRRALVLKYGEPQHRGRDVDQRDRCLLEDLPPTEFWHWDDSATNRVRSGLFLRSYCERGVNPTTILKYLDAPAMYSVYAPADY